MNGRQGAGVCVVGAGYVGLVTAACLAELGHRVSALETDVLRLAVLRAGELPFHEPGLGCLVSRNRRTGRLRFTADRREALSEVRYVFITVQTPSGLNGGSDVRHVMNAVRSVLPVLAPRSIVLVKSTVPVGTADELEDLLRLAGRGDVDVASNPEFLRQGSAVGDFLSPDRIVIGAREERVAKAVRALYSGVRAPVITCTRRSAELAKYAANAYLAARISFMNEVSALCETLDADIDDVRQVLGSDRRIGPSHLSAGLGWGGSCLPKDVRALAHMAARNGCPTPMLDAVSLVNERQREQALRRIRQGAPGPGATVGVLGLAHKPGTDDVRGSPALDIIDKLLEEGMHVRAHDPLTPAGAVMRDGLICAGDPYEAARGCDALLLATEWPEYLELRWDKMARLMRGDTVVDGRNVLDAKAVRAAGLRYLSFGRRQPRGEQSRREEGLKVGARVYR